MGLCLAFIAGLASARPCSAIENPDRWCIDVAAGKVKYWWTPRNLHTTTTYNPLLYPFGGPKCPKFTFDRFNFLVGPARFDLDGHIGGLVVDSNILGSSGGITTISNTSNLNVSLLPSLAPGNNAAIDMGIVNASLTGHRVRVDEGTITVQQVDAANVVLNSAVWDFAVNPLEVMVSAGTATFASDASGHLMVSGLQTDMSVNLPLGSENLMLSFELDFMAVAVPEPSAFIVGASLACVAVARRRRHAGIV